MYYLNDKEKQRLVEAIRAIYTVPFVDDVKDYVWEAIFSYSKDIPSVDPLTNIRSKKLFDVVDKKSKIGWSIKAVQIDLSRNSGIGTLSFTTPPPLSLERPDAPY